MSSVVDFPQTTIKTNLVMKIECISQIFTYVTIIAKICNNICGPALHDKKHSEIRFLGINNSKSWLF